MFATILAGLAIGSVLWFGLFGAPSFSAPHGSEAYFRDEEAAVITFMATLAGGSWIGSRLEVWWASRVGRTTLWSSGIYWIPRTPSGLLASLVAGVVIVVVLYAGLFGAPSSSDPTSPPVVPYLISLVSGIVGGLLIGTSLERERAHRA